MNDKEIAARLREMSVSIAGKDMPMAIEAFANELDPPYKLDRSLRGWVLVVRPTSRSIWWACYDGLLQWAATGDEIDYSWATVETYGWRVTKLHVLQPGEVVVHVEDLERVLFCAEQTLRRRWPYLDDDNHYRKVKEAYDKALDNPEAELEREKNR